MLPTGRSFRRGVVFAVSVAVMSVGFAQAAVSLGPAAAVSVRGRAVVHVESGVSARLRGPRLLIPGHRPRLRRGFASPMPLQGGQNGWTPQDLWAAYNLPGPAAGLGAGRTVAIVDAWDNPNVESDLASYRAAFGLSVCSTANGCFRKVNQNGGGSYPSSAPSNTVGAGDRAGCRDGVGYVSGLQDRVGGSQFELHDGSPSGS